MELPPSSFSLAEQFVTRNSASESSTAGQVVESGVLNGQTIEVIDNPESALDHLAEQMGEHFSVGRTHRQKDPSIEARHIESDAIVDGEGDKSDSNLEHLVEGSLPEKTARRVLDFGHQLAHSDGHDPGDDAESAFADATERLLALKIALADASAQEGTSPTRIARLQDAIADLLVEHGPELRAGVNVLAAAHEFSTEESANHALRLTYRDTVIGECGLANTLKSLLDRFGIDDIPRAVSSLLKALGDDLAAALPSREPEKLNTLIQDIYQLEVIGSMLDSCKKITVRLAHAGATVDPRALMRETIATVGENAAYSGRFEVIGERLGVRTIPAARALQSAVHDLLRGLPVKVFPNDTIRLAMIEASQTAVDNAIEREEAEA